MRSIFFFSGGIDGIGNLCPSLFNVFLKFDFDGGR